MASGRATSVPIRAAGDGAWNWHLAADELHARGHDVVAFDLPEARQLDHRTYATTSADA